jgi:uncharacterized coiled-coil protein SlyX
MSRLKNIVGWTLRGGDQTRAEFAGQAEAIRELQQWMAGTHAQVDIQSADADRLQAEVRGVLSDLTSRIGAMSERLDALEARLADHDELLGSLSRIVAPPVDD